MSRPSLRRLVGASIKLFKQATRRGLALEVIRDLGYHDCSCTAMTYESFPKDVAEETLEDTEIAGNCRNEGWSPTSGPQLP